MSEAENVQIQGEATQTADSVAEPEVQTEVEAQEPATEQVTQADAAESAPPPEQPKQATDEKGFDAFMAQLGDIPEEANEQLMESIDSKTFENMPDSAKGVLKHLIARQNKEYQGRVAAFEKQKESMTDRETKLRDEARNLIRSRAQLNKVLLDPKFQEFMKSADVPEEELDDPFSEKGMQQRIQKGVANAFKEFHDPIRQAAEKAQRQQAYQEFIDNNPKMKDAGFKKEVRQMMQTRRESGSPVSLEDAYNLVDRERMIVVQKQAEEKERTARAKSARRVARATMSAKADSGDPVPKWVTKDGYKGVRGNMARVLYLKDNPKALQKLREQQRSKR